MDKVIYLPMDPPGYLLQNGVWVPWPIYGPSPLYGVANDWSTSTTKRGVTDLAQLQAALKELEQIRLNYWRSVFVEATAAAIERRLPADFVQGRGKLAVALAEAEFDFEIALAKLSGIA